MDPHAQTLSQVAHGDKKALAALYRALEKPVYRFIHSRLNDPFESSDVLHDVFMEVWRSAARFEGRSKVQTWIFGIAYRKVIDLHRKRGRQDVTDDIPEQVDDSPDAETCVAAGQEAEHVRHCLETLKDDHRTAISLAFYEDMTYAEIAEVAGVPEGTVKTRVFHAKKLLMRCLSGRIERRVPA
ncbi:RNA polymerase sigma factor [Psychromarinibacter sp. C21-152]|uniref:RNA polymerase sigma factor n=1 Tax=Psychromarinibacter sediminicola TaxID=3033385 RepID=A0AAE3TAF6_9RHOB|nr:RNA polymerase sigma factor [Psychromarinibacter sediminicola]MDF0603665.1 RNA polymerase sigma factor [Psychromarinibacter sediminicola]